MNKLLDRLKQIDPATWNRYNTDKIICDMYLAIAVKDAWLQTCLQDAILTKGWHFQQMAREGSCMVDITIFRPECDIINGPERKTPAEAMLAAYIAACEAI
jgi:hypothetical protein